MSSTFDASAKLDQLLNLSAENELVEFKKAESGLDFREIGRYFSALCNEANLKGQCSAWLVFGINNQRQVTGSNFRPIRASLDSLKHEIATKTTSRITFVEIYDVHHAQGRVLLFEIPAAPKGTPVAFDGHYYGRDGESLGPLNIEEIERIRSQSTIEDWSAVVVPEATIDDLDPGALAKARQNFVAKFPELSAEADSWNDITFLNKAKLTIRGQITRAALLLLGKDEAEHFLQPADPKIRWILRDASGNDRDYTLFGLPLLLAVDKVFEKIRNLKYRYMPEGTLFPVEIDQYDPYSIRESINNAIAHQDYTLAGRINVVELQDELVFSNLGNFAPGSVERVVIENAPEENYRNRFLAQAMLNLKMVDTMGGGIRKMFLAQRKRLFPLPDYDLTDRRVVVTLTGKIIDMDYSRLLARNSDLSLEEIILLDRVQKRLGLNDAEAKQLKAKKLIEGRKPNYFVAKPVAQLTGQKAVYSKNRAFDKQYYLDLICKAIDEHGKLTRPEIDELLSNKLPDWMDGRQRSHRTEYLLKELRRVGEVKNERSKGQSVWSRP